MADNFILPARCQVLEATAPKANPEEKVSNSMTT